MTIQPLLHPTPPKSRFVTVVSWVAIVSGAGVTFGALTGLALGGASVGELAVLAGGVLAMVAGAGLNHREEWARQGFVFVQLYGMAGAVVDTLLGPARMGRLIGLAVGLVINAWIIVKLRSPVVRAEFEDAD